MVPHGRIIGSNAHYFLLHLFSVPPTSENKDHSPSDEENQLPLPSTLSRPRSHPDLRHGACRLNNAGASTSVPALYNDDDGTDEYDDDIVQELRECTGHSSHSSFRMNPNKEHSSSSGFSSPSIPDPPPPPRGIWSIYIGCSCHLS